VFSGLLSYGAVTAETVKKMAEDLTVMKKLLVKIDDRGIGMTFTVSGGVATEVCWSVERCRSQAGAVIVR
jgi:hypothetical protein